MNSKILRDLSYGVYIATTISKDKRKVGCTINSATQITSDPKMIAISINRDNYTNLCIEESGIFALSIMSENTDPKVIATFGYQSSKDVDKFQKVSYEMVKEVPVLRKSCGYLVCKVVKTLVVETHTIFVGEVIAMEKYQDTTPMTYSYYHTVIKGKTPKNAPTYEEESIKDVIKKGKWRCKICGYIYEGEELLDSFTCPLCGAPKEMFQKI